MELHGARQAEFCRPHFVVGPFAHECPLNCMPYIPSRLRQLLLELRAVRTSLGTVAATVVTPHLGPSRSCSRTCWEIVNAAALLFLLS